MRKILAVLMAVMMLVGVFASLPAFADEAPVYTSGFDGTKSNQKIDDLIITEIVIDSITGQNNLDAATNTNANKGIAGNNDAFDYIEVYNNSNRTISLYDYCILSANAFNFFTGNSGYDMGTAAVENTKGVFNAKNLLKTGDIHLSANGGFDGSKGTHNVCENPATAELAPGEVGVIWFWTDNTDTLCNLFEGSLAANNFEGFRQHYGVDKDTLVIATNAKTSAPGMDLRTNRVYALCTNANWAINNASNAGGQSVFKTTLSGTVLNPEITCLAEYTDNTAAGIITGTEMQNCAANYLPAYMKPDLYINDQKKTIDDEDTRNAYDWHDFLYQDPVNNVDESGNPRMLENGLHFAHSYRECAIAYFSTNTPTAGKLPAWQWMYLNADKLEGVEAAVYADAVSTITALVGTTIDTELDEVVSDKGGREVIVPLGTEITDANKDEFIAKLFNANMKLQVADWATAAIKTEAGRLWTAANDESAEPADKWETMCMADYLTVYGIDATETNTGIEETKKDYSEGFVDRDYLIEKHTKKQQTTTTEKKGLPVWALILIIVGGVLVAAGVAVVVIIVIKKKKPVAVDDVAAQGEVQIIDDNTPTQE